MTDFVLDDFLPYRLNVLARRLSREFSELYRERFGITVPEWRVVAHLLQAEAVSVREIHERVDMDKSKVSRAAARLEAAGYVQKCTSTSDRRLIELSLTEKGKEMGAELADMAVKYQSDLVERLKEDGQGFGRALEVLLKD